MDHLLVWTTFFPPSLPGLLPPTRMDHLLSPFQGFLQRHPSLASSRVYLAGQSYAGHYIPLLATKLIKDRLVGTGGSGKINLRGIIPVSR